jgi:hypothetical protein
MVYSCKISSLGPKLCNAQLAGGVLTFKYLIPHDMLMEFDLR